MDLSTIIVSWNTREMSAASLESVLADVHDDLESEIIVVDNGSTDGSAEMIDQHFPQVHLIRNQENVGFARANNQAMRQSSGRYVLLLNSDTEVHQGSLSALVQFMDKHPRVGGCGSRLLNADGSLQASCHPMPTPEREFWKLLFLDRLWPKATYVQERWELETPRRVEVIKGACFLLRRSALEQVGFLDEQYYMYSEEVDLCYRLARAGWELWWVPQAVVKHYGEASSRQMRETMYIQLYRSKVQFYRKFGGDGRVDRFKFLVRVAYGPRLAIATLAAPVSSSLSTQAHTFRRLLRELPTM